MEDFLNELTESTKKKSKKNSPKSDSSKQKRRPPSSNRNIFQFLDDLSIGDENDEKTNNKFDNNNDIFKMDFDVNKSDGSNDNQTEVKFNNTIFDIINPNQKQDKSNYFENNIITYLDLSLHDLSSNFLSTITELAEETYDNLFTEKVSNFLNDINSEINDIFHSEGYSNYDQPSFQTDEIVDNFTSQIDEINQLIYSNEGQIQIDQQTPNKSKTSFYDYSDEIKVKMADMLKFINEVLNDLKIERNKLLLTKNSMQETVMTQFKSKKETDSESNFINDILSELKAKELNCEIEKNFIEEKLTKIENKKKIFDEKRINKLKEKENKQQLIQDIIDSRELLFDDIKKYDSKSRTDKSTVFEKVSDFSQQMFVEITQCRLMINQLFQKMCNINQVNMSFENLKQMEFQNNLKLINDQNAMFFYEKKPLDFIEQTKEKLKEIKKKRTEAKKSIEDVS